MKHYDFVEKLFNDGFTFGIELECLVPEDSSVYRMVDREYPEFEVGNDGSIHAPDDYVGKEIKFKLMDFSTFKKAMECITKLYEKGVTVNNTCGLHIHVGRRGASRAQLMALYWSLIDSMTGVENAIFKYFPSRKDNSYCQTVAGAIESGRLPNGRYYSLNHESVREHGTVEFRLFAAQPNASGVLSSVVVVGKLIETVVGGVKLDERSWSRFVKTNYELISIFKPMEKESIGGKPHFDSLLVPHMRAILRRVQEQSSGLPDTEVVANLRRLARQPIWWTEEQVPSGRTRYKGYGMYKGKWFYVVLVVRRNGLLHDFSLVSEMTYSNQSTPDADFIYTMPT